MGYHSEVSLVLKNKKYDELINNPDLLDLFRSCDEARGDDEAVMLYWESTKWDEYSSPIQDLISNLAKDKSSYHLIILGEGLDDNQERGKYWDNPFRTNVYRTVEFIPTGERVYFS